MAKSKLAIPNGIKAIRKLFGDIKLTDGLLDPKMWGQANIKLIVTPKMYCGKAFKIWVNVALVDELMEIFEEIHTLELIYKKAMVHTVGGCWVVRLKRSNSTDLSTHAWGIAIDINPEENPQGGSSKQSQEMVKVFTKRGWDWGGSWQSRPDPMHFQRCKGY